MKKYLLIFTSTIIWVFLTPVVVASPYISQSAVIKVADPQTYKIYPWGWSYIPAGTLLFNKNKQDTKEGVTRTLFLTETGMHVYLSPNRYWNISQMTNFSSWRKIIFIKRRHFVEKKVGDDGVLFIVPFTRGESYKFISENEFTYKIEINDQNKLAGIEGMTIKLDIPKENASFIDLDNLVELDSVPVLEKLVFKGVYGIVKKCSSSDISEYPKTDKTNLSDYFNHTKMDGEEEKSEIITLSQQHSVRREYYQRHNMTGIYKITTLKSCDSSNSAATKFSIETPYSESPVKISRLWAKRSGLRVDEHTGRPLLQCPEDYLKIEESLTGHLEPNDIPFIIHKIAKWKRFKNNCPVNHVD